MAGSLQPGQDGGKPGVGMRCRMDGGSGCFLAFSTSLSPEIQVESVWRFKDTEGRESCTLPPPPHPHQSSGLCCFPGMKRRKLVLGWEESETLSRCGESRGQGLRWGSKIATQSALGCRPVEPSAKN